MDLRVGKPATTVNENDTLSAPAHPAQVRVRWENAKSLEELTEALLANMRLTCGARFEAAKRHKKRNRTSQIAVIILALYAMLASVLPTFNNLSSATTTTLNVVALFMSVLVIAFSLLESSKRHDLRSELFLKCAQRIKELHDEVKLVSVTGKIKYSNLESYIERYNSFLEQFSDNHAALDLETYFCNKGRKKGWERVKIRMIFSINIWIMPILAAISPIVIFIVAILCVEAYRWYDGFLQNG